MSRHQRTRQSLPAELQTSSKLTSKRFQFKLPNIETQMYSTQSYSKNVSVIENRNKTQTVHGERASAKSRSVSSMQKSPQSSPDKTKSNSSSENDKSILDDDQCVSLRNKYINQSNPDFSSEEIESLELLVKHLKVYSLSVASKGNYEEGKKSETLTEKNH